MEYYAYRTLGYCLDALPCMLIAAAVFLTVRPLWRRELEAEALECGRLRETGLLLFIMYSAALAALTVLPCGIWDALRGRGSLIVADPLALAAEGIEYAMLTPFGEIGRSFGNRWDLYMLVCNVTLFVPLGFFVSLLWRRARWYRAVLAGAAVSCLIETVQLFIGRSTSVDDVILNTAGAALGYGIFWLVRYHWPYFVKRFWTRPLEDWELEDLEAWDAPEEWTEPVQPVRAAEHAWGDETQLLWRNYFTGGGEG